MRERFEYTKATLEEIGTQPEQSELNPKTELVNMAERSMSLARKDDQMLRGQDKTALEAGYLSELQAFNKEAREKGSVWLEQVESSADSTAEDKIAALRAMSEIHDAVAITSRPPDFEQYEYNPDQALGFEASSDLRVKTAELLDQDGRTEEANKELAKGSTQKKEIKNRTPTNPIGPSPSPIPVFWATKAVPQIKAASKSKKSAFKRVIMPCL